MPELPEVEHAARTLRRWLQGHTIVRVEAEPSRILKPKQPSLVAERLVGHKLLSLDRRAKYLLFTFDGGQGALGHLGMTGKWLRRTEGEVPPHSRLRLHLDDGSVIHYRDPRLFGQFHLHPAEELIKLKPIRALGPDPLRDQITGEQLRERLRKTSRLLKVALMDQAVIGGLGNIHVVEALFRAKLNPNRKAKTISVEEADRLVAAIGETIAYALESQVDEDDEITYIEEGGENPFFVYGRKGEPCQRCKTPIRSSVHSGRSTFWCPHCQK
jgi:formamidopyrimidine-DNA glycosylase